MKTTLNTLQEMCEDGKDMFLNTVNAKVELSKARLETTKKQKENGGELAGFGMEYDINPEVRANYKRLCHEVGAWGNETIKHTHACSKCKTAINMNREAMNADIKTGIPTIDEKTNLAQVNF